MPRLNLKMKLILGGITMAVVPIIIISVLSYWKITRIMTREARLQTERIAGTLAASADLILRQQYRVADSLASVYSSFGGMDIDFYGGPSIDGLTERRL